MKKFLLYITLIFPILASAQVSTSPATPTVNDEITVTLNTNGTGLSGYTGDVYAHTGVLTTDSSNNGDWKYTIGTWGNNAVQPKLTQVNSTTYTLTISPDVRDYYNIPAQDDVTHLAFVFRSADGSKQTSPDIFVELYEDGLHVVLTNPNENNTVYNLNQTVTLSAESSKTANLELRVNNTQINTASSNQISQSYQFTTGGNYQIKVVASSGAETVEDIKSVYVKTATANVPLPNGMQNGINIQGGQVTFVLTAPNKDNVFLLGDFNQWSLHQDYQLNRDGDQFWITVNNLDANTEYAYQYMIDYDLKVADPLSTKVLDPDHDQYIPTETHPNIKAYPSGFTEGVVSAFKINQTPYAWQVNNFSPPNVNNLMVYELLLRDFTVVNNDDIGDLKSAFDRLDYLESLGVNAIELMPVNEFEGNDSWGYNPSFHNALDKAYGTPNDLKKLVDECHKRGIAVLLDVVYNHAFSQSPLAKMYWDSTNFRPAADNPWLNQEPTHDFNVGYDFNHESDLTKSYVKQTLAYWLNEYKIDGFRYDLSKGFTQKNTLGNPDAMAQYDASRIAILKDYANHVWQTNASAIQILEHFAVNQEEKELSEHGFLLWGNSNYNYNQNTMGYDTDADISWISYKERGWTNPHVMGYMESHDEERLMYKNIQYGNSNGGYNVKDLKTALAREELAANFFFTIPGPKMLWQFGELGYDVSINHNGRTGRKPVRWYYYDQPDRRKVYDVWATLMAFRQKEVAFQTDDFTLDVDQLVKKIILEHTDMDVVILGNFDVSTQSINPTFTQTGTWYEYYTDATLTVSNTNTPISLQPGEYRLYSTKQLKDPLSVEDEQITSTDLLLYPNPAQSSFQINKTATKVEIFDYLGRSVRRFEGTFYAAEPFTVEGLEPGMYVVKIENNNQKEIKKLLVK